MGGKLYCILYSAHGELEMINHSKEKILKKKF